jgi:hypothetical protein
MRLYMKYRQTDTPPAAAAKASFSSSTAYRFEKDPWLPSQKKGGRDRRRPDPLAGVFETEVVPMLKAAPGARPVAIFEEMLRRHPELGTGIRPPIAGSSTRSSAAAMPATPGGSMPSAPACRACPITVPRTTRR